MVVWETLRPKATGFHPISSFVRIPWYSMNLLDLIPYPISSLYILYLVTYCVCCYKPSAEALCSHPGVDEYSQKLRICKFEMLEVVSNFHEAVLVSSTKGKFGKYHAFNAYFIRKVGWYHD